MYGYSCIPMMYDSSISILSAHTRRPNTVRHFNFQIGMLWQILKAKFTLGSQLFTKHNRYEDDIIYL